MDDADEAVTELAQGGGCSRGRGRVACRSSGGRRVSSQRAEHLALEGASEAVVANEAGLDSSGLAGRPGAGATDEIRAYDAMRMIQRDGNPTPLGEAIAHYGRIFKTLHILTYAVEEPYRRDIKGVRNLQESRHALAGKIFHSRKGEIYQRYYKGMEDQLGALGLVLNCVTLWNTFYMDRALDQLKAEAYPLAEEDVARLSPFVRQHLNVIGTYSFAQPDLGPAGVRQLPNPDEPDWEEELL
ncbi:Tn3 family transposase [Nonomuraea sp. CA-141351]|uniref:Tn3 family transposase n=1 Tax=Nonomuraea sp. CA-141351 TaxID=3239996 RepID=UPI003D91C076